MRTESKLPADAPAGSCPCWKCNGSGKFFSNRRYFTNPQGQREYIASVCYPCRGKGWQSHADQRRTNYYYAHVYNPTL